MGLLEHTVMSVNISDLGWSTLIVLMERCCVGCTDNERSVRVRAHPGHQRRGGALRLGAAGAQLLQLLVGWSTLIVLMIR